MINPLRFLLDKQLKLSRLAHRGGFTLIELLVTIVISSIIFGSLLTFMTNMLASERQEQAKATTEQELQAALDYIANDLQEAIYIYDADGITAIKNQLPDPAATDKVPVLVFWKRTFLPKDRQVVLENGTSTTVGCLAKFSNTNNCDVRDYFVYSLVAYYLIKNNDSTWSSAARIGRFEIQDGIREPQNLNNYLTNPTPGFKLFDLTGSGTLKDKMNAWKKDVSTNYDLRKNQIETLVDYIDQSTGTQVPKTDCTNISSNAQQVPKVNDTTANPLGIYSFYACVDSSNTLAQVYIRGNALARLEKNATYSNTKSIYFPAINVQVKSRELLSGE